VQEKVNADVKHEHFEKPIMTTTQELKPIIKHSEKDVVVI